MQNQTNREGCMSSGPTQILKCEDAAEFVSALCDSQSIPQGAAAHIDVCETCQARLKEYGEIGTQLRHVASLEPPLEARGRTWEKRTETCFPEPSRDYRAGNLRRYSVGIGPFAINSESTGDRGILNEEAFRRMISLERRRTERSRKPFLLMLLDMGDHLPSGATAKVLNKILAGLSGSTRETDVAGWYKSNCVVGVMFTECALEDRNSTVGTMIERLGTALRNDLSPEQFNQISVSVHMYPEEWNHDQEEPKRPSNPTLYPDLSRQADARRVSGGMKRVMDVVGSVTALILASPVFLAIAIAIKATSEGPVFFRQKRIGQYGTPFVSLKFRSMYTGNDASTHKEYVQKLIAGKAEFHTDANSNGVFKLTKDPRITRVGAFLRRSSLDELPQLINVLKGEMSLVGPRPPLPYEVEKYDVWHRRRLLEAKPGITGLWQVSGRCRVKFDDMVRLDLHYARTWSPWEDIKILVRTLFVGPSDRRNSKP
jgi:lipopolysaccharide/colanic/teichoic acid biosynthesis glycosyltransferase